MPPTEGEREQSFREGWSEFRRQPRREQVKTIGGLLLVVPLLAVVFFTAFFLFGGWTIFADRLPAWAERLFTFLLIVLIAWGFLRPVFDRWQRDAK